MIPVMDDELGRHWEQPIDIRDAPMDDTHVLLTEYQFAKLLNYSASIPTGVYPGKCWWALTKDGTWFLRWFSPHATDPKLCTINHRRILVAVDK